MGYTQSVFPGFESNPVVCIGFTVLLMKERRKEGLRPFGKPVPHAIWALEVFKHNGWGVEIFCTGEEVGTVRQWVYWHAPGLVDLVNEYRPTQVTGKERWLDRSLVGVFMGDRDKGWWEKGVDLRDIMMRLDRRGFLRKGLLPLERGEMKNEMIALLKEPIFRELMLALKARQVEDNETRSELIKLIEDYIKHPGIVSSEYDLLKRARAEGQLLESVLKLLARDQFDPVGCVILAQQDRGLQVDQMSSLSQVDID